MLLQRLAEYAQCIPSTPTLYVRTPVRYIIELKEDGTPSSPVPTDTASQEEKRGTPRLVPAITRSVGVKPLLLADSSEYTLNLVRENSKPERAAECHKAYLELVGRCWRETEEPAVKAVLDFLQNDPASKLSVPEDYDRAALVTFRVGSTLVVELPSVQAFWARVNDPDAVESKPARRMQCLVCGQEKPVLSRLQGKIKGIPGGQAAGTSIISANALAFESYGLEASLVAPTCAECGEKFTKAVNYLLSDRERRVTLANTAFIFWTREDDDFNPANYLNTAKPEAVHKLLSSLVTGRRTGQFDETAFYAAALSGSNARAVVRDWIDTTVGAVQASLGRWFELQRIVGPYGEAPFTGRNWPLNVYTLAATTVRDPKDLVAQTARMLVRTALLGTPLPSSLLRAALSRNQAEREVSRERAALIKMVLLSQDDKFGKVNFTQESEYMVKLNSEHPDPAYHCGRLLCVLEDAQRAAQGSVNASLIDRFYGSASSTPAIAFPPLLKNVQNHLGKLENSSKGAYVRLQRELEEVMGTIGEKFPRTLSLEQQGLFALGYYHQRAHNRAKAMEASERKKAASESESEASTAQN